MFQICRTTYRNELVYSFLNNDHITIYYFNHSLFYFTITSIFKKLINNYFVYRQNGNSQRS